MNIKIYGKGKGQAAVTDALLFMMICAGAATLLAYVAGLYGTSTNQQMLTIYNYEFAGTALVSLHYARDLNDDFFWLKLKEKLTGYYDDKDIIVNYLNTDAQDIWSALSDSSSSPVTVLKFESGSEDFCYNGDVNAPLPSNSINVIDHCKQIEPEGQRVFTSSVKMEDSDGSEWVVTLKLFF